MPHALDGIRVIDIAINYAGPASSMYLADQGAEVVKVEARGTGDTGRRGGNTPYLKGNSRFFMAINRGKRSITVDIRKPRGQEIVRRLAARADVFIENFRPGVCDRLNIGYEALSKLNPRLIYGSVTAFGTKGPYADKPGFDRLVQGMGGSMYRKNEDGMPLTSGVWIADYAAPMLMAYGIMLALWVRERTGLGQKVESSLLQATISMQWGQIALAEDDPTPIPSEDVPSYGSFQCSDGVWINVAALFAHQFARLCRELDLPHLAEDPRLNDPLKRFELHREAGPIFQEIFKTAPSQEWLDKLLAADVPCGPIVELSKVAYEPQVVANDMMVPLVHPVAGRTRIPGVPVRLSNTPPVELKPAPTLGQHTDEILQELGYSGAEIEDLRQSEVI